MATKATESIPRRAWQDFARISRGHHAFNVLLGLAGAAGAAAAELAPADASTAGRVAFAGATALGAVLFAYLVTLAWSLVRAPFRQRREMIALLNPSETEHRPQIETVPGIEPRTGRRNNGQQDRYGQPVTVADELQVALIRVFNGQEHGGRAATAEHVIPELSIFEGDNRVFHWKGWDVMAARDFTTGHEEHALWLAAKWKGERDCSIVKTKEAEPVRSLSEGSHRVELIIRGHFPDTPVKREFRLINNGVGADLELVAAEPGDG